MEKFRNNFGDTFEKFWKNVKIEQIFEKLAIVILEVFFFNMSDFEY